MCCGVQAAEIGVDGRQRFSKYDASYDYDSGTAWYDRCRRRAAVDVRAWTTSSAARASVLFRAPTKTSRSVRLQFPVTADTCDAMGVSAVSARTSAWP